MPLVSLDNPCARCGARSGDPCTVATGKMRGQKTTTHSVRSRPGWVPDEFHPLATTKYRAEDAVRACKVGDRDKARKMLLAALRALPPASEDGKVEA